jgi:hypothetical protein
MTAALGCVVLAISKDLASNHPRRRFDGGAWVNTHLRSARVASHSDWCVPVLRNANDRSHDVNATANVRCVASPSGSLDPPGVPWTGPRLCAREERAENI